MNDLTMTATEMSSREETISRLVAPRIFASENAADHAALRAAHFAELDPRSPYETALAETLVRYEWEMARLQRFRDSALLATYRDLALKALLKGDPSQVLGSDEVSDEDRALVRDLVSCDPDVRYVAERELRECSDWEPADLLGLAYARSSGARSLDDRIADLERRRKILRDDYARLQASRPSEAVEDAELVETSCDD